MPAAPLTGQKRIDQLLQEHYVDSDSKELIKSRIREKHEYVLLGSLQVRLDTGRDHYWAEFNGFNAAFTDPWGNTFVLWVKGGDSPQIPEGWTNE